MSIRHFLDLDDIPPEELKAILAKAHALKKQKFNPPQIFEGLSLAMVFDKKSTRTRMSFEIAMKQLGGHTLVMGMDEIQISGAESVADTANVVSRYVDACMIRMSDHDKLSEFASECSIPVINGMTDVSHPCQIMADILTIEEKLGDIQGKKIAWFGDWNNVSATFAQAEKIWDFELVVSCPEDVLPQNMSFRRKPESSSFEQPDPAFQRDDTFIWEADPLKAAESADVIVTDTWVSMGQEEAKKDGGIDKFKPYSVTPEIMAQANDTAIFMHCMPIHENEEVSPEVLASAANVIYDEAENRLHAQKAILAWCLEDAGVSISQKSFNFGNK